MELRTVIVQTSFLIIFVKMLAFGFLGQEERKCKYLRVDKLLKIRCFDMNLKEVPQDLKSSVEVLDLSFNRIKKLRRVSFQRYKSIKYLLLYENMIQFVEPGTLEPLTSLQEIDLSNNALLSIPLEIFELPSLRNLYVDSNELSNLEKDLERLNKPIDAPLEYINVADCGLNDLPDLGILPKLWHINASSNPLTELSLHRFANMCHLKSIDLMKTSISDCECQQVNNHLRYLGAKTKYVPVCLETLDVNVCPPPLNRTVHSETFQSCKNTISAETRSMWLFGIGCIGGFITLLILFYCCIKRRRKHRSKRREIAAQSRKQLVILPKNAINHNPNDELLRCDTT